MNYLSHYYFDRNSTDPALILGGLLPDMVRPLEQKGALKPSKHADLLKQNAEMASLYRGWERHKTIDKYFHASVFFEHETALLKTLLKPIFSSSGRWTFFMAHILLELCLDGLLLRTQKLNADNLYRDLSRVEKPSLEAFFKISEGTGADRLNEYLQKFIASRYLFNYHSDQGIIVALDRICMKLWKIPFTDLQSQQLALVIPGYMSQLEPVFMTIFEEIEKQGLP